MAHSVLIATASAGLALVFTALIATPSMAMSFSDYDGSAYSPGNHVNVNSLVADRLNAAARKRDREAIWLETLRETRGDTTTTPNTAIIRRDTDEPFNFTLPFSFR